MEVFMRVGECDVPPCPGRYAGFTYLVMLFAVAISGAMLAAGSVIWQNEAQRNRERELLKIGEEFRRAIGLYYERTPGAVKRYPEKLEDLLRDDRYLSLQRYLRRIYHDPMTGKPEWGLVSGPGNTITGVYSLAPATPMKVSGFADSQKDFAGAPSYSAWRFVYRPTAPITSVPEIAGPSSASATSSRKTAPESSKAPK